MRLDRERDRGNISDETELVNDGGYLAYAETSYGPWTIEYERASEGGSMAWMGHPERVTVKGPFIGERDGSNEGEVEREVTVGVWSTITDAIDHWDYVELADEEVFDIDG